MTLEQQRQYLDAAMGQRGDWPTRSPWIREAVAALPRDTFAPGRLYEWDGAAYRAVERGTDPDGWARLLYADPDAAAVTQITDGLPTSSLSCQAVVVDMLDSLLLEPGQPVLELGTGSGWNTALLAQRTSPEQITSIEVDNGLAEAARTRLPGVYVRVGDGAQGWPAAAPYDRVISTYAVERIPWAWIEQTSPGGRIVTPWGHLGHVALTVAADGRSATGWVQGLAQFMPARGTEPRSFTQAHAASPERTERPFDRDPAQLAGRSLLLALRVAMPDVHIASRADSGPTVGVHDGATSWAVLTDGVARQGGPRRLADEIETAWDQWLGLGSPGLYAYGLTVTADEQYAFAIDPETGPRWAVTPAALARGAA